MKQMILRLQIIPILLCSFKTFSADAFSVAKSGSRAVRTTMGPSRMVSTATIDSSSDTASNILDQLGVEEGKLALGLKPSDVLKYVGTREDLIAKTMADIPSFDRTKAEGEVDKFLMDFEMMNLYVQYGKEIEKDPNFVVPDTNDEEGLFSFRTVVILYLIYVAVTTIPDSIRRYIAEQQVEGVWQPTNIPFIDDWIEQTSSDAMSKVLQRAAEKTAVDVSVALTDSIPSTDRLMDTITTSILSDTTATTLLNVADAVQAGLE